MKDPGFFTRLLRGQNRCRCFCVELVKHLSVYQYSVDIFSYTGPSGILDNDGKQNTTSAGARKRENCCTFHWFL